LQSLCFAESEEKKALAYGNRSAVFMQVKKYEECLQNIKQAKKFYPAEKIKNLNECEERCKKLIEEAKDPKDDALEYFKLSYPPNPKIPFIIDGLEIRDTGDGRKGIFTTRDLNPGDVISSEEPCFRRVFCSGQYNRCCLCLKVNNMNLLPCLKTASMMFCSEKCRKITYKDYDIESMIVYAQMTILSDRIFTEFSNSFRGEKNLCKFLRQNDLMKLKYTYFDFDWSDENDPKYQENKMKCLLSANMPNPPPYIPFLNFPAPFKMHQVKNELKQLIEHLDRAVALKIFLVKYLHFQYAQQVCGEAIYDGIFAGSFPDLLQHSCMPNVLMIDVENKIILTTSRIIKSGEQLFRNT
jgi:tetratricopeptide (TPR) repeat protein